MTDRDKIEKGVQKFMREMNTLERIFEANGKSLSDAETETLMLAVSGIMKAFPGKLRAARATGTMTVFTLAALNDMPMPLAPEPEVQHIVTEVLRQVPPVVETSMRIKDTGAQQIKLKAARIAENSTDPNAGEIVHDVIMREGRAQAGPPGTGFLGVSEEDAAEANFTS